MATLMDIVDEYTRHDDGTRKKWKWNECDCIGLLFHVVNRCTGKNISRASFVPSDLGYKEAIKWLHDANDDPLLPFMLYIVDTAGVPCYNMQDWNLAIMYGDQPIKTSDARHYPIHLAPGIAIRPSGHHPYVMGKDGLINVSLYPNDIRDFITFKLDGF